MSPLQDLLQQLHELQQPYATQFDDRLLIALLLALAAGHRNLVVRVTPLDGLGGAHEDQRRELKRERKEWIKRVADEVEWICSNIFALTTHRVACSPKTPPSAFVKSLFLPPPELVLEPQLASRRQQSASESAVYPSSAPPSHLTFEEPHPPYTGPSPEAGDSSAGEDLYPTPLSSSLGRRNTLSPKLRSDSPDRRRAGGRRHTLGARDLLRPSEQRQESLVGLGLGGGSASGKGDSSSRLTPPRATRPTPPRSSSGSGYFNPQGRSPLHQQTSYISQSERRPSIASIQSTFSASTATPPTPTANRFLRSPGLSGPPSPPSLTAPHVASPLASPSFVISPAPRTPRASSPTPSRAPTHASRTTLQGAATYPPITRPMASSARSNSSERSLPQVLILEHLERARPSAQQTLLSILRDERIVIAPSSGGNHSGGTSLLTGPPRRGTPAGGADDASSMRTRRTTWTVQTREEPGGGSWEGSWNLPEGFVCVGVVWDEDRSGREEHDGGWGGLSRHLLDRFTLSHSIPATTLLSPSRFYAPPPLPHQPHPLAPVSHSLLSPLPLPSSALPPYLSDTLDTYLADLLSALRHHPQIEGRMLTARANRELEEMVKVWVALTKEEGAVEFRAPVTEEKDEEAYERATVAARDGDSAACPLVLPADVLSVVLATLGHRLALRRPRDEKSLFWGSDRDALDFSLQDVFVALVCVLGAVWLRWKQYREQHPELKVERLFLYPIKGVRPLEVQTVELCELGFRFDRRFVLVSPKEDDALECHLASGSPSHQILQQSIDFDKLTLTITAPSGRSFTTPLQPPTETLKPVTVNLHQSPVLAFDVGDEAAEFFTAATFGVATRLMFLSENVSGAKHGRKVLGNISDGKDSGIAFQDCASYMIASSASLNEFSKNLGRDMDIRPLRSNMLVGPAGPSSGLKPWVEDFWAELRIADAVFRLTSNCVRCVSLNIDYETGKRLEGSGLPLQVLAKDRRIDIGAKYSPVFGRYAFSHDIGVKISVGDRVRVTKLNKKHTVFAWPGMGTPLS
ncbi:hypothetical protein JCM6882_002114 [Rhodosporidiobolus microsporus]